MTVTKRTTRRVKKPTLQRQLAATIEKHAYAILLASIALALFMVGYSIGKSRTPAPAATPAPQIITVKHIYPCPTKK